MEFTNPPVVFLSGGMRSGWQDQVIKAVPGPIYIDPSKHGLKEPEQYTAWDLKGVRMADIVFGYLEADNPSGAGLAVEMGAAHAQGGKTLAFVFDEQFPQLKYFGMVRAIAHISGSTAPTDTCPEGGLARVIETLRTAIDEHYAFFG